MVKHYAEHTLTLQTWLWCDFKSGDYASNYCWPLHIMTLASGLKTNEREKGKMTEDLLASKQKQLGQTTF